jgi:hypothetical protein
LPAGLLRQEEQKLHRSVGRRRWYANRLAVDRLNQHGAGVSRRFLGTTACAFHRGERRLAFLLDVFSLSFISIICHGFTPQSIITSSGIKGHSSIEHENLSSADASKRK